MKKLENLLAEFRKHPVEQADGYAKKIIRALACAMGEDKEFIIPAAIPDEIISRFVTEHLTGELLADFSENFNFSIHTLTVGTGDSVYAAFTNYPEVAKGRSVSTITTKIDHYLEAVLFNPAVTGLIINPFGDSCFLSKELIREVFELDYIKSKSEESKKEFETVLNTACDVDEAVSFALRCHRGTFRKGTDTPYIIHPLETARILNSVKGDYNLIIAGLLHDTAEDCGVSLDTIREKYGEDVARLVGGHSEDKSKVWYARKLKTIRDLPREDIRSKLLTLGDKLSNIRSMYSDYKQVGEELWDRFNAPKSAQSWYYSGIVDGLAELQGVPACADAYGELNRIYKELFVKFFIDEKSDTLYQISAHGEGYFLEKGNPQWQDLAEPVPDTAMPVSSLYAERIEDNWGEPFWQMHGADMADKEVMLFSSPEKDVIFAIRDEQISLSVNGDTVFRLSPDDSHRLLTQLRIHTKEDKPIEQVLRFYFGAENCTDRIIRFAAAVNIDI